jgi:hypothetical protein
MSNKNIVVWLASLCILMAESAQGQRFESSAGANGGEQMNKWPTCVWPVASDVGVVQRNLELLFAGNRCWRLRISARPFRLWIAPRVRSGNFVRPPDL